MSAAGSEIVLDTGAFVARADEIETIVREYGSFVYQVAFTVLRNHHDAEDVSQETFIKVMRNRKKLSEVRNMRAWLARICWRVALSKRKKRSGFISKLKSSRRQQHSVDPEKMTSNREIFGIVESLIDSLPEKLKDPLILSTIDGMSSKEISQVLEIPDGTVRTRILRARQLLHQKLEGLIGEEQ